MRWILFSDFDGTLTDRDSIDTLVEHYLGADYQRAVTERIRGGISSVREVLAEEFSRLSCSPAAIRDFLAEQVHVDPDLPRLIEFTHRHEIRFEVLSSGMDLLILPLLEAAGCRLPVHCNRLVAEREREGPYRFHVEFRDDSANGHDKAAVVRDARGAGRRVIYLGDGTTDMACAHEADILFARRSLARYCDRLGIPYYPLHGCADVLKLLRQELEVVGSAPAAIDTAISWAD